MMTTISALMQVLGLGTRRSGLAPDINRGPLPRGLVAMAALSSGDKEVWEDTSAVTEGREKFVS